MLPENESDILIVDDILANLQFLSAMLKKRGYKVRPATSGPIALQAARARKPDLILLDVNMPEMSGYEVCAQLKADENLRDIPVIFISALNETIDKVAAFTAGGVDYVTKPFQFEEVEARVGAHLRLRRLQMQLEKQNRELLELQQLRDNLTHMIVHDMRSPLTAIIAGHDLIKMTEGLQIADKTKDFLVTLKTAGGQLLEMINCLLDVSKLEAGEMELNRTECDLGTIANQTAVLLAALSRGRLKSNLPEEPLVASVDRELIFRVLQNLVSNALKFTPRSGTVTIVGEPGEDRVTMAVVDTGPGIPPEYHERIFEKFGQVESDGPRVGTGLGLTFCRLAVNAHGGEIGVESEVGQGSRFWFTLPRS